MTRGSCFLLAWLALSCSGSTGPVTDQSSFDFSFDDPAGDTTLVTPLPDDATPATDLLKVSGTVAEDRITLVLDFAEPVERWSAHLPNSLDGFVDFDTDTTSRTGVKDAAQDHSKNFGLGVEYYIDLRDDGGGHVALVNTVTRSFTPATVTFSGKQVRIEISRTDLVDADGNFYMGVLVGDRDRPVSDLGPDPSHYQVVRP